MAISLTASPDAPLIEPGTSAPVSVQYINTNGFFEIFLWERIVGEKWQLIDLASRVTDPIHDVTKEGIIFQRIGAGQIYQVRMYHEKDANPNEPDMPRPDAQVTVVGLAKGPDPANLAETQEMGVGGTWASWHITTTVPTFFTVQVSAAPPEVDGDGMPFFVNPLAFGATNAFDTNHFLEVASWDLVPGNSYHALVLLSNEKGEWQVLQFALQTKLRKVTIVLDEIHVINDGDFGDNKARFSVWVKEGGKDVRGFNLPEREISDRPDPGKEWQEHIKLPADWSPVVIGPAQVTLENATVSILTRGVAPVVIGKDQIAGNFVGAKAFHDALFRFGIGSADEEVQGAQLTTRAIHLSSDDEFEYSVTAFFTVEYV
ncbi:hypothetical protein [Planotetraspora kaengkrachanensis]|uniref:Uncharacterized protein n=1 Tax=Planotetraspora kaengkrachanensis TaxID=575193 RepID=A0A8J3PRC4_9ACTN|nr:hypothetical protein [Planotetraspora kaengkrachanensis]GIG79052.1 hypothetical protein Pka01_21790 [Planotetraspora kaengkrachanensis]